MTHSAQVLRLQTLNKISVGYTAVANLVALKQHNRSVQTILSIFIWRTSRMDALTEVLQSTVTEVYSLAITVIFH